MLIEKELKRMFGGCVVIRNKEWFYADCVCAEILSTKKNLCVGTAKTSSLFISSALFQARIISQCSSVGSLIPCIIDHPLWVISLAIYAGLIL